MDDRAETPSAATVCFRHPDRETRLACSNCGRPICYECTHDAAVGQRCPVCVAEQGRTRVVTRRQIQGAGFMSSPVTYTLMVVAIGMFVLGLLSEEFDRRAFIELAQWNPLVEAGEWWRVMSAAVLHASLMHVAFNMYALYLFGPRLERQVGSVPFAVAYAGFAAAGGAAFYFVGGLDSPPAVGASGAIFGLFGVWTAATWRIRHTPAGRAMFGQLVLLLAINAALTLFIRNIAWEAHLGGFVAGVLVGLAWGQWAAGRPRAEAIRTRTTIAAAVLIIPVVLVWLL
jgi:membrane associated rhomboid family serine protease